MTMNEAERPPMSDPNKPADTERDPARDEAPPAESAAAEAAGTPDQAEALATENAALKDRLLRTLADMENLRRRTEKEIADARAYAVTGFARDMLNVADNVRRAIESVAAEDRAAHGVKPLLEGVELTERDLLNTLERHGIRRIEPKGERFDPNRHQAMFEIEDPNVVAGTVLQVMQAGFSIGERVLRPALVGVAKGGPKSSDPA